MLVALVGFDLPSALVGHLGRQALQAQAREVVAILPDPGVLPGALEAGAGLAVGDQVGRRTVALIEKRKITGTIEVLIAETQRMPAQAVGEQPGQGTVIHFTVVVITAA